MAFSNQYSPFMSSCWHCERKADLSPVSWTCQHEGALWVLLLREDQLSITHLHCHWKTKICSRTLAELIWDE
ncbi:hypothetical protein QQF64_027916 [Cirrhinus molitorella]|uniref:Uncharacterized protein n=1 Tax=Cirrhinus molitorella TaxID=172907 RepID=A0ABR3NDQ9_9TELE